jgi:hypothetical protein
MDDKKQTRFHDRQKRRRSSSSEAERFFLQGARWRFPQLRVTMFSTFVSENSALGAKLIVAARSQREVRLKRGVDDKLTTLSMLGFCSIML